MDVTSILTVFNSIDSALNKRNALALNIEKSFKNKKMTFYKYFFLYLYLLTITPMTILVLFNKNYLDNLITNDVLLEILKTIITLFDAFPLAFLLTRLIRIDRYYSSKEFRDAKKEIYKENKSIAFEKTKEVHRNFRFQRIKAYFIENWIPVLVIAGITIIMYKYSLHNLIGAIVIIIMMSYFLSSFYDKSHSLRFYISDVKSTLDDAELLGREIIRIGDQNLYISNKEFNAYYYDGRYLLLKYKASNFEAQDINLFLTYLNEYIELLNGFKKSNMCKEKQQVSDSIKSFEEIASNLLELI